MTLQRFSILGTRMLSYADSMTAEIFTTEGKFCPPEQTELLLEQMNGRNARLMEQALLAALARVQAGHTHSLIICEFGERKFSASAFVAPTLSKLDVAENLRTHLPGLMDTLDG